MRSVFPEADVSEEELLRVAEEAYVAADHNYGVEKAIEWGRDFVWDKEVAVRDVVKLRRNNYNNSWLVGGCPSKESTNGFQGMTRIESGW